MAPPLHPEWVRRVRACDHRHAVLVFVLRDHLGSRGLDAALAGKAGPGVSDQEVGFMAMFIFATHPLTWLILYFAVEGSVRLVGAAFTESDLGILPLFVLDKIFLKIAGQSSPSAAQEGGYTETNL